MTKEAESREQTEIIVEMEVRKCGLGLYGSGEVSVGRSALAGLTVEPTRTWGGRKRQRRYAARWFYYGPMAGGEGRQMSIEEMAGHITALGGNPEPVYNVASIIGWEVLE